MIPYGRQSVDDDDIAAVTAVLKGEWLTQGPHIEAFEEALIAATSARYAVAFSSGTAALHASVVVSGLGSGDIVATSPLSFAASATCARYAGASVAFVDIDPDTLNLALDRIPAVAAGLVAVHYAGLPADLRSLRRRPGVVIEDAAHALGALTPDGPVGNCANSDLCVFSFHPVKAITSGEGGAVTTNDRSLADHLRRFRNHGLVRRPEAGGWYYEISELAWNYRLTDIQAALGTSQLSKLERFITRRQSLAARYHERLGDLPLTLPPQPPAGFTHAYHLFPVQVAERRAVYEGLREHGIAAQVHYVPIYRHPLHAARNDPRDYPATEAAYERLLSLPLYPDLTEADQDVVIDALGELL